MCAFPITYLDYAQESAGFSVVASYVPSRYCGGVAIFYKVSPCLVVKAHQQNDPNVFSFQMAMGGYLWYVVG